MAKAFNPASIEEWDSDTPEAEGELKIADEAMTLAADQAAGTQLVSIRMSKSMIDAFKAIAASEKKGKGIGYQTLMKQILQRFIDGEMNRVWNEHLAQQLSAKVEEAEEEESPRPRKRKVA